MNTIESWGKGGAAAGNEVVAVAHLPIGAAGAQFKCARPRAAVLERASPTVGEDERGFVALQAGAHVGVIERGGVVGVFEAVTVQRGDDHLEIAGSRISHPRAAGRQPQGGT